MKDSQVLNSKYAFRFFLHFRIYSKTVSTIIDGASEYKKCFKLFGAPTIDGENTTTIGQIQHEYEKDGKSEEFKALKKELMELEYDFTNLSEIWETDVSLPRRIRCNTHNFALTGVVDFGITKTGKESRTAPFWKNHPHAGFKSKFN